MLRMQALFVFIGCSLLIACGGGGGSTPTPTPGSNQSSATNPSSVNTISSSHLSSSSSSQILSSQSSSPAPNPITPIPDSLWQPSGIVPPSGNYVYLESNDDAFYGIEQTKMLNNLNAEILFSNSFRNLSLTVMGKHALIAQLRVMDSLLYPAVGLYQSVAPYQSSDQSRAGFSVSRATPSCAINEHIWFAIDNIALNEKGQIESIEFRFEQLCPATERYIRGKIYWDRSNSTQPVAPIYPVPSELWNKTLSEEVENKNYAYLEYRPSNSVGTLQTHLLLADEAKFNLIRKEKGIALEIESLGSSPSALTVNLNQSSEHRFKEIDKGYYQNTMEYLTTNSNGIGISFYGLLDGIFPDDCDPYSAWFAIDDVKFEEGQPTTVDLRFEINCKGLLNGKIRILDSPKKVYPQPSTISPSLWQPNGVVSSENISYVYLDSVRGDYIGQGKTYEYTNANSLLRVEETSTYDYSVKRLQAYLDGDESWMFDITAMIGDKKFKVGYYEFSDLSFATLNFGGEGRGCNSNNGWYTVDKVEYDAADRLDLIDIRFAQYCENSQYPLYGKVHWRSKDTTVAPGPVFPSPNDLWQPPASIALLNYNYLYVESDEDDFVGDGKTYLFTQSDARFVMNKRPADAGASPGNFVDITIHGDNRVGISFSKHTAILLEPGLYQMNKGSNPVKGSLFFSADGRGCNNVNSWFAIDDIAYDTGGNIESINYRFEQRCSSLSPDAVRGKGFWQKNEPVMPPSPVMPVPSELWSAKPRDIPASGNYLLLDVQQSGWFGPAGVEVVQDLDVRHVNYDSGWQVIVGSLNPQSHALHINGMYFHDRLQPGYYPNIRNNNPTRGHIDVTREGKICENVDGWYAIDKVTYDNTGTITSLHARFKQQCQPSANVVYGQLRWNK